MIDGVIARFGHYEVDFDRLELRVGGQPTPVEPQVFDVLRYLLEHRDRLVTKMELLDEVWGDRFVGESALTSRVKSARQAVGDDGRAQAVIKTVHGQGYRFVAEVELVDRLPVAAPVAAGTGPASSGAEPDPVVPDVDRRWPMIGRHEELEELTRRLLDPACHGVLITGPAGIGKSRLAREVLERARSTGAATARVVGHPGGEDIPFASLAHLLPADVLDAAAGDSELAHAIAFQRARAAVEAIGQGSRPVLLVDNADHVDELTAGVLASLVGSGAAFAVLTQRTAPGDALVMEELVRGHQLVHLALDPLDDADLDVVLYRVLAGPIDVGSLQQLTSLAEGRPGALQQMVEVSLAGGALRRVDDTWRLVEAIPLLASGTDAGPVGLGDLEPAVVPAAEVLALAEDLALDVANDLLGIDVLDSLDRAGLLAVSEGPAGPRVSLAHAHVARLLRERTGRLRARRHKVRLVEVAGPRARTPTDRMRVVRWQAETGGSPPRAEVMAAALHADSLGDDAAAEALITHLDATAPGPDVVELKSARLLRLGAAAEAERLVEALAPAELDDITAARAARTQAWIRFHVRGRFQQAVELLAAREAELRLRGLRSAEVDDLRARRVGLLALLGQPTAALEAGTDLPEEADGPLPMEGLWGLAAATLQCGRAELSLELLDRHDRAARRLPRRVGHLALEQSRATAIDCHLALGEVGRATELARRHLPVGSRAALVWLPLASARAHLAAGHSRAAHEVVAAPRTTRGVDAVYAAPLVTGVLAQVAARLADRDRARHLLEEATRSIPLLEGHLRAVLAASVVDATVHLSDPRQAAQLALAEAELLRPSGAVLAEAELLAAAGRAGAATAVTDRLAELAAAIDGPLWALQARHVEALAAGVDDATLAAIASAYGELGQEHLVRTVAGPA